MLHYYRLLPAQAGFGQPDRAVGNKANVLRYAYRISLFIFTLWLSGLSVQAQAPPLRWQKTLGGTLNDRSNAVTATGDGGLVVAGYTLSNNGDVTDFRGGADYWVVKLLAAPPCGSVVYVTPDGAGVQDGSSWANAFAGTALQTAINTAAGCGAQVWVAQGTYKPTTGTDRTISFAMQNGVAIYGGFVGSETMLTERNIASYPTVLSGDIGAVGDAADNSYHVINNPPGLTSTAVLDGVVITAGNANGTTSNGTASGGGMYNISTNPTLTNCSFLANTVTENGGGIYNGNSSSILTNCSFLNNTASNFGGGMYNQSSNSSSPILTNCSFLSNSATSGGGVCDLSRRSLPLTNCSFLNNTAGSGGAIYKAFNNSMNLLNCSFLNNTASGRGGAICIDFTPNIGGPSNTSLVNCVVFSNGGANSFRYSLSGPVSVRSSLVEMGVTGYTNGGSNLTTTVSPFVSSIDARLKPCSPAINAGDNAAYTTANGPATDLAGNPRLFNNGPIDMGAYEYQGDPITVTVSNPAISTATVGQAFSEVFTATGGAEPYSFNVVSSNLPVSLSLSPAGVLSGTPTEVGSYTLLIQAGDANGCVGIAATPFSLTVGAAAPPCGSIVYVTPTGAGLQDGSSWANAFAGTALQTAINTAATCDAQVWVAQGTYKPTSTTDRNISFSMQNGVSILGGFPDSGNPDLTQRSPASFTTILSGDIGTPNDNSDNSYHVVQFKNASPQTLLDGFVITEGNASGFTSPTGYGGAIFNDGSDGGNSSPTLTNLSLIANVANLGGAGLYTNGLGGTSSPVLTNVSFIGNSTPYEGGAMHTVGNCSPILTNVCFIGNSAESGGGMFNKSYLGTCLFVLTNVSFLNNFAYVQGGAMYNTANQADCQFKLTNVSLLGNYAPGDGGAIVNAAVSLTISNGVIFGNQGSATLLNYSSPVTAYSSLFDTDVTGYTDGGNNQTTTNFPFVSATDLHQAASSPAINTGDNAAYTAAGGPPTDLAGNVRIQNGTIDMGAYEFSLPTDLIPLLYVTPSLAYSTTTGSVVVDVFEINVAPTSGLITVHIAKSSLLSLSFDPGATSFLGRPVQNSAWTFDGTSSTDAYILTSSQVIGAGGKLSVGLRSSLTPGQTRGSVSVTATLVGGSGGEVTITNNADADKLEYFNK